MAFLYTMMADILVYPIGNKMCVKGPRTFQIRNDLKGIGGFRWNPQAKYWYTLSYNNATIMAVQQICVNKKYTCDVDEQFRVRFGITNIAPSQKYSTPAKKTSTRKPPRKPVSMKRRSQRATTSSTKTARLFDDSDDDDVGATNKSRKRRRQAGSGEVEVVQEKSLDEQIADRERIAAENGDLVDLC